MADSNNTTGCFTAASGAVTCGSVGTGSESSFDINTDTQGNLQIKWVYVEFPLPLVPFSSIVRLGAQPFATAANYKLATYANGDFAGVNLYTTISPTFKLQMTYVAIDENLLGKGAFGPFLNGTNPNASTLQNKCIFNNTATGVTTVASGSQCVAQSRGDNYAFIGSPEITVMKGLDIKPMFSTVFIDGLTNASTRVGACTSTAIPSASTRAGARARGRWTRRSCTSSGRRRSGTRAAPHRPTAPQAPGSRLTLAHGWVTSEPAISSARFSSRP